MPPTAEPDEEAEAVTGSTKRPEVPAVLKGGRFQLDRRLGAGAFGEVWLGRDMKNDGALVAFKLEIKGAVSGQLVNEYDMLHDLKTPAQQQGFLAVHWFATEMPWTYMVMECLGKDLDTLFRQCGRKFETPTVGLLGEQCLFRLETLHSRCYIHRDIKPENFMMGVGPRQHIVYVTDFGLSEKYIMEGEHLLQVKDTLTGTAAFASLNAHNSSQSRRDDLESLGFMLVYFLTGTLPWIGLEVKAGEKDDIGVLKEKAIIDKKAGTPFKELCKDLPQDIELYLKSVRKLSYKQRPDYIRLREHMTRLRNAKGEVPDYGFQWIAGSADVDVSTLEKLEPYNPQPQPDESYRAWHPLSMCVKVPVARSE